MTTVSVSLSPQAVHLEEQSKFSRFGLIALATDLTSEKDMYRLLPDTDVSLHATRVAFANPTTPNNLRKMGPFLTDAADLIVPGEALAAICYSCTAASVVIGDVAIAQSIGKVRPGVPVVTPTGAARMAFDALGVNRIAVLTPYTVATSEPMAAYFSHHGLDVTRFECLGLEDDREMARVSNQTIVDAALAVDNPDAEVLFISCTGLPAIGVIAEIEKRIGKPVVTSNQASGWAMTRLGRFDEHIPPQYGRLFECALPEYVTGKAA